MPGAGQLRERLRFYARGPDRYGEPAGKFAPVFECAGRVVFLKGGETVLDGRLKNEAPAAITVRAFAQSIGVDTGWRCEVTQGPLAGTRFDIKDVSLSERRDWVTILGVSGAADGGEVTEADG